MDTVSMYRDGLRDMTLEVSDVRLYGDMVYFDHWLIAKGYPTWDTIRHDLIANDHTEEEAFDVYEALYDEFAEWAEEHDLEPQSC